MRISLPLESDFQVASIPNLHAKVSLFDSDWGLIGSGNLTGTGLGGAEGASVELGALLDQVQMRSAEPLFAGWWAGEADPISADRIGTVNLLPI